MGTKRVAVRPTREHADGPHDVHEEGAVAAGVARPRPSKELARARQELAEALPEIAMALLERAKEGSVTHLKLLMELGGVEKEFLATRRRERKGKSLEAILMEEWARTGGDVE